jgi:glucose/arabinose dehydrogenase
MKKSLILFAAVALMAMTACNEKPAKNDAEKTGAQTEQVQGDTAKAKEGNPKLAVEKAAPTADGKDHIVAEFSNKDYQVRVENLADGTYRLSLWKAGQDKAGKPETLIETKNCILDAENFVIMADDGTKYIVGAKKGAEQLFIMNGKEILYPKLK